MFVHYARRKFILQPIHGFTRASTLIMKINRKVNRVIGGLYLLMQGRSAPLATARPLDIPAVRVSGPDTSV